MSLLYHAWTRSPCQFPLDLCLINQNEPGTAICIEQDVGPGGRNESWNMKDHSSPQTNDGLANFDFWPFGKGASHCKGHLHIVEVVIVCCFDERLWFCPGVELYITERCCLNMFFSMCCCKKTWQPGIIRHHYSIVLIGIQLTRGDRWYPRLMDQISRNNKGFPTKTPANHLSFQGCLWLSLVWSKSETKLLSVVESQLYQYPYSPISMSVAEDWKNPEMDDWNTLKY